MDRWRKGWGGGGCAGVEARKWLIGYDSAENLIMIRREFFAKKCSEKTLYIMRARDAQPL